MFQFVLRGFYMLLKIEFEGCRVSPPPTHKYIQQRERIDDYGKKQTKRDMALPFMGHHFLPTLFQAFLECLKAFLPTLSNLFLPYWKVLYDILSSVKVCHVHN